MGSLFECGLCHFRNMAERDHIPGNTRGQFNVTLHLDHKPGYHDEHGDKYGVG